MLQVLSASRPELIEPITGLAPRTFRRLVAEVERRGGRLMADRVLLVATYYRTNLAMRELAQLSGIKTTAVHRTIDRFGPFLALAPARKKSVNIQVMIKATIAGYRLVVPGEGDAILTVPAGRSIVVRVT